MATERPVTASRLGRLGLLGSLAGGIAGGVMREGARQLARGRRPTFGDLLLTPENARRLTERLSEMRGAAMKVGQLLSMDSGDLLPRQLSEVLARLRENAHRMPLGQVAGVLNQAWGEGWEQQFTRFSFTPLAAASIGQVHEAVLKDGRRLAVKVQYPGIRRSIDSDVDNVASVLRLFNLLPRGLDFQPLLDEAKRQLHGEADYLQEAAALVRFAGHLNGDPRFQVPAVLDSHSTAEVLTMGFLDGRPIESLAEHSAPLRNGVATALTELALREVFEWGFVQTDPNFANYLYRPADGRIQLLDFGATRAFDAPRRSALRALLGACLDGEDTDVARCAAAVGYLDEADPVGYRAGVVALLRAATEPVRGPGPYAFGDSDLARRMGDILMELRVRNRYGRLPPPSVLFLHRKLGGLYLLLARLRATVAVGTLIAPYANTTDRAVGGDR